MRIYTREEVKYRIRLMEYIQPEFLNHLTHNLLKEHYMTKKWLIKINKI